MLSIYSCKVKSLILIIFLGIVTCGSALSNPTQSSSSDQLRHWQINHRPASVLVKFKPGLENKFKHNLLTGKGLSIQSMIVPLQILSVQTPIGEQQKTLNALRSNPAVEFAELDYSAQASITESLSTNIPNDPEWKQQWSFPQINVPSAWEVTTGTSDVIIAVLDSGIDVDHEDLTSKLWINSGEVPDNQIDDDHNGKIDDVNGWHFYHLWTGQTYLPSQDGIIQDYFGHGSHVAGIAAAATNNAIGVAGISQGARIMPVKVLDEYGSGWYSDIAAGIVYAAENGADIINLSLGGSADSQTLRYAVDYAHSKGTLVVSAAGNTGEDVFYPAAIEDVLAVAATNKNDQPTSFSNFGPQIDIAAPGVDIFNTWYRGNYFTKSGTSMATAHVSGVAALMWSRWPDLSESEIASTICQTAVDIGQEGVDENSGCGLIDANQAVRYWNNSPDLWVKNQAADIARPGDVITYTITYGNRGNTDAFNVRIDDSLPSQVLYNGTSNWHIDVLPAQSGPFTFTLPALVTTQGVTLTNKVTISSLQSAVNNADKNTGNNSSYTYTYIKPDPDIHFTSKTSVRINEVISFNNTTNGTEPISYLWDFGDGATSTSRNPTHIYSQPGSYKVTLIATNIFGNNKESLLITLYEYAIFYPFIANGSP